MRRLIASSALAFLASAVPAVHAADLAPPEFPQATTGNGTSGAADPVANQAFIQQSSSFQTARIAQSGIGNWASIDQSGNGQHVAVILQTGSFNRASIVQR